MQVSVVIFSQIRIFRRENFSALEINSNASENIRRVFQKNNKIINKMCNIKKIEDQKK